ncbi:hypothetical protein [Thauera sp.]|uniref:hypothetical protein n=1 Tax=Thauera sp. TaxID=1905334 RepID=UPI002C5DEDCB|nr:hypothetical protein [Thauera sp.]HRP23226.1 hypothetical protein [Thauera sp.]
MGAVTSAAALPAGGNVGVEEGGALSLPLAPVRRDSSAVSLALTQSTSAAKSLSLCSCGESVFMLPRMEVSSAIVRRIAA